MLIFWSNRTFLKNSKKASKISIPNKNDKPVSHHSFPKSLIPSATNANPTAHHVACRTEEEGDSLVPYVQALLYL